MPGSNQPAYVEWSSEFNISLGSDSGGAKWQNVQSGSFLDLSGGGGNTPALHGWARDKGNPNQDWTTMKVNNNGGGLIIVNEKTKRIITMTGPQHYASCIIATADAIKNPHCQWERRQHPGGNNVYWLVCKGFNGQYCLDLGEGKSQNGTPIYTYPISDAKNRLWKMVSWSE